MLSKVFRCVRHCVQAIQRLDANGKASKRFISVDCAVMVLLSFSSPPALYYNHYLNKINCCVCMVLIKSTSIQITCYLFNTCLQRQTESSDGPTNGGAFAGPRSQPAEHDVYHTPKVGGKEKHNIFLNATRLPSVTK